MGAPVRPNMLNMPKSASDLDHKAMRRMSEAIRPTHVAQITKNNIIVVF